MGYSVRTPLVRYTEWRDWETAEIIGRELYDAINDPAEMHSAVDNLRLVIAQDEATSLLRKQFPLAGHGSSRQP
jgi:hypothetical protein